MKPILFVLQDFDEGGVQRVTLKIANQMVLDGRHVSIVILKGKGALVELLDPAVEKIFLNKTKVAFSLFSLFFLLLKFRRCNLVSAIVQVNILCAIANALIFFKHNHVITEHTHSSLATLNAARKNLKIAYFLQPIFYPLATKIYCVSKGIMDDLIKRVPKLKFKTFLISNPVLDSDFFKRAEEDLPPDVIEFVREKKVVLGVGRLVPMKDFNLLIDSFASASRENKNLVLLLVGDGPQLQSLRELACNLNVQDKVRFIGHSDNPLPYFKRADVFVLTSKYEGFGLVLVEALALSNAVVSVNCECGPAEILINTGNLVDQRSADKISDAILYSLANTTEVKLMRRRAADFKASEVVKLYYKGFI